MKHKFFSLLLVFLVLFSSCTAEIELKLNDNGSVAVDFKGSTGEAFSKMVKAVSETQEDIFDTQEISTELSKSGFSNVLVQSKKMDITVSMIDEGKSYLFTSGLVQKKGKTLSTYITPKNLVDFYSQADEQIVMILDLLIAPIFNDEQMSESEYLEILGSLYGDAVSNELSESVLKITVVGKDGQKSTQNIPMAKILCLAEEISLHSSN